MTTMRLKGLLIASLALNIILLAALLLKPTIGAGPYDVYLAPGLTTRLSAADAANIAVKRLDGMSDYAATLGVSTVPIHILTVTSTRPEDVGSVEPRAAGAVDVTGPIWVVRAEGPFVAMRGRGPNHRVFDSGYFVINDATGDVLVMGMP